MPYAKESLHRIILVTLTFELYFYNFNCITILVTSNHPFKTLLYKFISLFHKKLVINYFMNDLF
jgi:hypothetical protein